MNACSRKYSSMIRSSCVSAASWQSANMVATTPAASADISPENPLPASSRRIRLSVAGAHGLRDADTTVALPAGLLVDNHWQTLRR